MQHYTPYLSWIDHQKEHMKELVTSWANINTHAQNLEGLERQLKELIKSFSVLDGHVQELTLAPLQVIDDNGEKVAIPLGKALHITKRTTAPIVLFFGGHMDTVYAKHSLFQRASDVDAKTLRGPGVSDMKGGLVILLAALQAFEKSPYAANIGWELYISPDEEIGSPGSKPILERIASRTHFGLLFEPAHPDGALVSERSGSENLVIVVRGKAAHAGRDFEMGRSALLASLPLLTSLDALHHTLAASDKITMNIGEFRSGHGFNIIPDIAVIRVNLRGQTRAGLEKAKAEIQKLLAAHGQKNGIKMELHTHTATPPKEHDPKAEAVFTHFMRCAELLSHGTLTWKASRGASDGNFLAACGLANIDSLGAQGGDIHTHNEFLLVDSLVERAKLIALFLMKVGNKEIDLAASEKSSVITL